MLWLYILDNCDHAGVIELYLDLAAADTKIKIEDSHFQEIADKLHQVSERKYWVKGFIRFQYGKLSKDCKPHKPVFDSLERHGINPASVDQNERFVDPVDSQLRKKIIGRDDSTCAYSGKRLFEWEIHIDHVVSRKLGGSSEPSNLVVMDSALNTMKSDLTVRDFCTKAGLDFQQVSQRLSKATKEPSRTLPFPVASQRLQDPDKTKTGQGLEKEPEKVKEGGTGGNNGDLDPVFVSDLKAAYRRTPDSRMSHMEEATLAEIIRERPRYRAEWDIIVTLKQKEPRYFPQSLSKLLIGWQDTLDRASVWVPDAKPAGKTLLDKEIERLERM